MTTPAAPPGPGSHGDPGHRPRRPPRWVRAAYLLADVAEQAAPGAKLPTQSELTTRLGISPDTATRACQELARLGLIHLVPGHGYHAGEGA